ncbi:MAG TPA: thioredoxin domain-containing protein [Steroidobacteraceae bacterium]|nr:thioredoxin domain-containing protein [Steroidobacteraceae bacterium]
MASLAACSRSEPPAPAAVSTPATAEPAPVAPAPAAEAAPVPLTHDQLARLVQPHSPVFGRKNARVTVVEVLDPACEACKAFAPVVEQLLFLYPEDVRVVVRYADFHPVSLQAIRLLEAARAQDKVHEVLSALFNRQQEWASHTAPNPAQAWVIASEAGLDMGRARQDALAKSVDEMLHIEAKDLNALKVERTPTFFVNGKPLPVFGAEELMALVASEVQNR